MVTLPIQAVFFDVYNTLLKLNPAPADANDRWRQLKKHLNLESLPDLARFQEANEIVIARHHVRARTIGIGYPEIYWPQVVKLAWPVTTGLSPAALDDFLFAHARLVHSTTLNDGAANLLGELRGRKIPVGIVSNAQPYTLRELEEGLKKQGLSMDCFRPEICFWSFESGFSKPDPHVFSWLEGRLRRFGIQCSEALIVGDRLDNDILPAQSQGFQTWMTAESGAHSPANGTGTLLDLSKTLATLGMLPQKNIR
ncbi:MAG: HAD family hydrolase [Verrucomicrobiae bacterium]|nr:HAD family hydrolase [Verrucomicrobiae bacterium]